MFACARSVFRTRHGLVQTMCRCWMRSFRPFSTNSKTSGSEDDDILQVEELMDMVEAREGLREDVTGTKARRRTSRSSSVTRSHSVERSVRHYRYRDTFVRPSVVQEYHRFCDSESMEEPKRYSRKAESRALAKSLKSELGLKDLSVFAKSPPSVLGVTEDDVKEVVRRMKEAGFNSSDVELLLKYFPCTFNVDFHELKETCRVMDKYDVEWRQIIRNGCGVFSLGPRVMGERLKALHDIGIRGRNLSILWHYPSVLMFPLSHSTLQRIAEVRKLGFLRRLNRTVCASLINPGARITFGSDTKAVIRLLKHYDVTPDYILQRAPAFFGCSVTHLESVVQVLVGHPFYMDSNLIKYFFISHPAWFIYVDPVKLRGRIDFLQNLYKAMHPSSILNILFRSFHLLNTGKKVEENYEYLKTIGFSEEQLRSLCVSIPSVLCQDLDSEVKPKFQLLLGIDGMDHATFVDVGYKYLLKKLDFLQSRIEAAKAHHREMIHVSRLSELFASVEEDGDVSAPVNVALPSTRHRRPQKEGKRKTDWKSKVPAAEGGKDGEEMAVQSSEKTSAVESMSRFPPHMEGLSLPEYEANTDPPTVVRGLEAVALDAPQAFEKDEHQGELEKGKSREDRKGTKSVSDCSSSLSLKEGKKGVLPRRKERNRRRRHKEHKVTSAAAVSSEEEEEVLLEVLDDILQ